VFEDRILRKLLWHKREEVTGDGEKYTVHSVMVCAGHQIRVIRSRRIKWAGNVTRMGEKENENRVLVRKCGEQRPVVRPTHRWEIILKCIFKTKYKRSCFGLICLSIGTVGVLILTR
jgi:hypothetical protein